MAKNPLNLPGYFGSEDIEKMNKNREKTYRKNNEAADMMKAMQEMGMRKFREMFGQDTIDELKEIAAAERRLGPVREKIRLQSKLKADYPMCEKCRMWGGVQTNSEPCPYDNDKYEKNITFETNEISQNPFPIEVCEYFVWKKEGK